MKKKIILISNDFLNIKNKKISSNFNDTVNLIEAINKKFEIFLYSRNSKEPQNFCINIKKNISRINFLNFLNVKNLKIFMISITIRNFIFFHILNLFNKNIEGFVLLRSNGHKEYKVNFGLLGYIIYELMFKSVTKKLKIITVSKNITKKAHYNILPSELDLEWFKSRKNIDIKNPKLLYLGRFKREKGFYSLIKLIKNTIFELTLAGDTYKSKDNTKNINYLDTIINKKKVIELYDSHNIFILPSFTEGYPKVLIESLSRYRPVIIFKEISHTKSDFKGVFISRRNKLSLKNDILFILNNYKKIQNSMKKNILPTKKKFQKDLLKILDE